MIFASQKRRKERAADFFRSLMFEQFSVPELNLMCIYDTSSKSALLSDLKLALADVYEPEMREVFESVITKLKAISDEDFADIGFFMADEFVDV